MLRPPSRSPAAPRCLIAAAALAAAPAANACPFCDSERAAEVRAGIFDDRFIPNLAAAAAPFAICAGVALAVHGRTAPRRGPRP